MKLAPITLFTYNRLWHTQQTIESLKSNHLAKKSDLYIFSDGPKNSKDALAINEVRDYLKTVTGFNSVQIIQRDHNLGLANSIIQGVTQVMNEFTKVIVLEDDMISSPYFLSFMNDSLELYKDNPKVASIHGYIYPIKNLPKTFFIKGADCWGWATWADKWGIFEKNGEKLLSQLQEQNLESEFDFNDSMAYTQMLKNQIIGKNNSWAIRWYASAFLNNMLTLYPGVSFIHNIGNDDSGTHCIESNNYDVYTQTVYTSYPKVLCKEDTTAKALMAKFFKGTS